MFGLWIIFGVSILGLFLILMDIFRWNQGPGIGFGIMIILIGGIVGISLIDAEFSPLAAEQAQQVCEQKGFDTYDEYKRKPFGTQAFGVKCNHIFNKKEFITDAETVVAVTS